MDPMSRTGRNCSMALVVFSSPTCHQDESVNRQDAAKKQGKDIRNFIWSVAEAVGKTHLEGRSLGRPDFGGSCEPINCCFPRICSCSLRRNLFWV